MLSSLSSLRALCLRLKSPLSLMAGVPTASLSRLFLVMAGLACVVFLRSPSTDFIFDEQEALLASDYLAGSGSFLRAFSLDFWGLTSDRSIGSYRPLPPLVWRAASTVLGVPNPFGLQALNILGHALVATLVAWVVRASLGADAREARSGNQLVWLAGILFCLLPITSEAVLTVVGLADILAAASVLGAVLALGLSRGWVFVVTFLVSLLGLLSKETALTGLMVVPLAAWLAPGLTARKSRTALAVAAMGLSLVAALMLRQRFFLGEAWFGTFEFPALPIELENNPLIAAGIFERLGTTSSVFFQETLKACVPFHLSGDYSFPRQPLTGWSVGALLGLLLALSLVVLPLVGLRRAGNARAHMQLVVLGALWIPLSYFPVSNLVVLLPTIRAERLYYQPAVGVAVLLAVLLGRLASGGLGRVPKTTGPLIFTVALFALQSRSHANHFRSDVAFWEATALGRPASAKAHLNLGVMQGARGDGSARIRGARRALELNPNWALGRIYLGDALCREGRLEEAQPHYLRGLGQRPNSKYSTALALQCLWTGGGYPRARVELEALAARHPETWLAFFVEHLQRPDAEAEGGVAARYLPRGYNQRSRAKP